MQLEHIYASCDSSLSYLSFLLGMQRWRWSTVPPFTGLTGPPVSPFTSVTGLPVSPVLRYTVPTVNRWTGETDGRWTGGSVTLVSGETGRPVTPYLRCTVTVASLILILLVNYIRIILFVFLSWLITHWVVPNGFMAFQYLLSEFLKKTGGQKLINSIGSVLATCVFHHSKEQSGHMNLCKNRSLKQGTCLSLFNNLSKTAIMSFKLENFQYRFFTGNPSLSSKKTSTFYLVESKWYWGTVYRIFMFESIIFRG